LKNDCKDEVLQQIIHDDNHHIIKRRI